MTNHTLLPGAFPSIQKYYRSRDGRSMFTFRFVDCGQHLDVYCTDHPSLHGRDDDPRKTHLFSSGKLCFVDGREPTSLSRAEQLAGQWAEYWLDYRRTGRNQE